MTKEDVITILRQIKGFFRNKRIGEAVDMAIDALLSRGYGEWIQTEEKNWMVFKCSECGEEYIQPKGISQESMFNYCPNCGEKMIKEKTMLVESTIQEDVMSVEDDEDDFGGGEL